MGKIVILSEKRTVIETLKYSDKHKKVLNSVLLDKFKLDGELELEEEESNKEIVRRILKDVLCQVGVTTILANFLILDIPVDRDVPIVVGRSFLYTCGSILNTIKGTTSTFDGVCHRKFYVAEVRNNHGESDNDDEEEYCLKRDEIGKPFNGPNYAKYQSCDDPMERSLALQKALNPFKKSVCGRKRLLFLVHCLYHYNMLNGYQIILGTLLKRLELANGTPRLWLWTLTGPYLSKDMRQSPPIGRCQSTTS
ncbi:hypothetical protein Tco_1336783 [Tanacetum coccineum]